MATNTSDSGRRFSEAYAPLRVRRAAIARERHSTISEDVLQCIWYDQLIRPDALRTDDGRAVRVVSPGWWNRSEGPDFRGAQIEFNGRLRTGDVELHLVPAGWRQHGHHLDARYDDVILHVTLDGGNGSLETASGRPIPNVSLRDCLEDEIEALADRIEPEDYPHEVEGTFGHCAAIAEAYGSGGMTDLLHLAGEWRMLFKARTMRERMDRVGRDQAVYEALLTACGYAHFKRQFEAVARALPYDRARQLAQEDGLLLEAAFLQIAGLLPNALPEGTNAVPHFGRLRSLRGQRLEGLRPLPLEWKRVGVRPTNYPERRFAGAAHFLARTAQPGLVDSLEAVWAQDEKPLATRRAFEDLFLAATGFWANHCTWTGKRLAHATAPIGSGRIRSIIGNTFIATGLALARENRDRRREERILAFFAALPKEPDNHIQTVMLPRLFGEAKRPKLDFRTQQGLLQMYRDWCEPNPSCRNCSVVRTLQARDE